MSVKQFPAGPLGLMLRIKRAGSAPHFGQGRSGVWKLLAAAKSAGQVTIELLLVLPVFMTLLFFIMEMGNLGFQTILAHHCAYELARIGSMVAGPNGGQPNVAANRTAALTAMNNTLRKMFPSSPGVNVDCDLVDTVKDQQSGQMGQDLLVTLTYPAMLIFPVSSQVLSDPPKGSRISKLIVMVRMPVEKPYFQ
ncbi:MAG: pilus assembly protein [Elusimicrobiota bacterium]|nr:pilus assembly protein [Elusimicrobiota bacterium]